MTEAEIQHDVLLALGGRTDLRIWRNNVGKARDATGRHVSFGLAPGAPDIVGILGPIGRFLAIEVKSATGRVRPEQINFLDCVRNYGGIAAVVRSTDEAVSVVELALAQHARGILLP